MISADVLSSIEMIRDSARRVVNPGDLGRIRKLDASKNLPLRLVS